MLDASKNIDDIIYCVKDVISKNGNIIFDPTLVRGMSYYTGTIFEIAIPEFGGSCGGGGRYDKMVGKFTGNDVPACGFSIGFERIILLLMENGFIYFVDEDDMTVEDIGQGYCYFKARNMKYRIIPN